MEKVTRQDAEHRMNGADRAEIEAKRGIVRDSEGKILRSKEWRENRIAYLKGKIEDFSARVKNAKAEIKAHEKELA